MIRIAYVYRSKTSQANFTSENIFNAIISNEVEPHSWSYDFLEPEGEDIQGTIYVNFNDDRINEDSSLERVHQAVLGVMEHEKPFLTTVSTNNETKKAEAVITYGN